jgi:hypothetical protein
MAAFNKFQDFVEQLGLAKHNLNTDTQNVYLSNAAPSATNTIKANIAEITNQNGYTAPIDTQNTWAESSGTGTLTGTMCVVTATGTVGPFQYVILYNDTQTSPADALIGWWDYGSALTLANGETFSVKFNNSATTGTILTIA